MDELVVGPNTSIRLRRACERNRLEKQFLIDAYEHLVLLIIPEEQRSSNDDSITTEGEPNAEHAHASEVCGVGHD
jgi:hypothetical protein